MPGWLTLVINTSLFAAYLGMVFDRQRHVEMSRPAPSIISRLSTGDVLTISGGGK